MVVKVRLEFSPTRCEAIRFVKIIHSMGEEQLGRHKVPLLASVQRHLEKDGFPIFFGLTVRHGRLRDTTQRPYKANARGVFQPTLPLSAHGWLVSLQGRRGSSAKRAHAVEPLLTIR